MGERSPFIYNYGASQGRIKPTNYSPVDGEYVYVLGSEIQDLFDFAFNDYIQLTYDIDVTGIDILRIASKLVQPLMAVTRDVSGYDDGGWTYTATLQRSEVLSYTDLRTGTSGTAIHAGVKTTEKEDFDIPAGGADLVVSVDGGGDQTIVFTEGTYTATQVVTVINGTLSGGAAQTTTDGYVIMTSDTTGLSSTIRVKDAVGADANDYLFFPKKISSPYEHFGGDDLSAIIAPDANFTAADWGAPLKITGASASQNNAVNRIIRVVDSETAILKHPVVDEAIGFNAVVRGALWKLTISIEGTEVYSKILGNNRTVTSRDLGVNVSKTTGEREIMLKLALVSAS